MPELIIKKGTSEIRASFTAPVRLADVLREHGVWMDMPCGGSGKCKKCRVKADGSLSPMTKSELDAESRLACQTVLLGDSSVELFEEISMSRIQAQSSIVPDVGSPMQGVFGAAIDIGTTTLALSLYELSTGKRLATVTEQNPQTSVAADVMGRIGASLNGMGGQLEKQINDELDAMLKRACALSGVDIDTVGSIVIAGNTTMLYLLTGRDPDSLSHAPFEADCLFGFIEQVNSKSTYMPPCMHAFVGADITCAVLASGMCETGDTSLLADIGTNGEIALWTNGRLYVTSTAAGPAFEGNGIKYGCGSIPGAIDALRNDNGRPVAHTIDEVPAVGICGSGLIDAVSVMLSLERIDETGRMEEESIELSNGICLVQRDVRNVQLAKAAISAGIHTLVEYVGIDVDDVKTLYIAGGFGSHLDVENASNIGLIPAKLKDKVNVIGNASLAGAAMLLLDEAKIDRTHRICACSTHVDLGGNPVFNRLYTEQMMFEE